MIFLKEEHKKEGAENEAENLRKNEKQKNQEM